MDMYGRTMYHLKGYRPLKKNIYSNRKVYEKNSVELIDCSMSFYNKKEAQDEFMDFFGPNLKIISIEDLEREKETKGEGKIINIA